MFLKIVLKNEIINYIIKDIILEIFTFKVTFTHWTFPRYD